MTSNLSNVGPSLSALVVGGGMITEEVVLPTVLQQMRLGKISSVTVVSRRASTIQRLQRFPNQFRDSRTRRQTMASFCARMVSRSYPDNCQTRNRDCRDPTISIRR
jgi:hypothetical protein